MYYNYFKNIENKYKKQLSKQKPVVIRLDGRNVTKSGKYNFYSKNLFSAALESVGTYFVEHFHCIVYIAMDEISFIFENPDDFFAIYEDNNTLYCSNLFLLDFIKLFWTICPNEKFGVTIFNIEKNKIESYIKYRKSLCYNCAIHYYAKHNIQKQYYVNKKLAEIVDYLKENDLYKNIETKEEFLYGKLVTKSENKMGIKIKRNPEDNINNIECSKPISCKKIIS